MKPKLKKHLILSEKLYQILLALLLVLFSFSSQAEVDDCREQHSAPFVTDNNSLCSSNEESKYKYSSDEIICTSELNTRSIRENHYSQGSFDDFLLTFSGNVDFQKKFTHFPLQKLFVRIDADPEPKPEEILLDKSQVYFPIYPHPKEIERLSLILDISQGKKEAKISIRQDDTDYLVSFFFEFNDCWYLIRVEDWSL